MSEKTAVPAKAAPSGKTVEKKKPTEVEVYKQQKEWLLGIVERAPLRGGVTKEQLALSALQSIKKHPELVDPEQTDMESFRIALVDAGQMGLIPDGRRGALVKYNAEVQFQPMVWGIVELMYRAGVKKVESRIVHEKDRFELEYGTVPRIVHVPAKGERGAALGVYGVVWLPSGETQFEYMTAAEVHVIRGRSKSFKKGKGPWITDELEMWRKTVIKRLGKYVPQTEELTLALRHDDEVEYVESTVEGVEVSTNGDGSLNDRLAAWRASREASPAEAEATPGGEGAEDEAGEGSEESGEAPEQDGAGDTPGADPEPDSAELLLQLDAQYEECLMEYRPAWGRKETRLFEMGQLGAPSSEWTGEQYRRAIKLLSEAPRPEGAPRKKVKA